jgi:hypothetical protein
MEALERLDRLAELLGAGDARWVVDWRAVEAELGVGLPADYRAFVERFGAGWVNQELYVVVPSAPLSRFDLVAGNAGRAKARRLLHQESSQYCPALPRPPPGWLLVCGKTDTRASLYWRTDGLDPDTWPVVLYDEVDWVDGGRGFLDVLLDHPHRPEPSARADRVQPRAAASLAAHAPQRNPEPDNSTRIVFIAWRPTPKYDDRHTSRPWVVDCPAEGGRGGSSPQYRGATAIRCPESTKHEHLWRGSLTGS